jgi:hypothetical protein
MIKLLLLLVLLTEPKGKLPNRSISPGEVGSTDTAVFCHSTYTKAERKRETAAVKREVYRLYGMVPDTSTVVDHIIPLELGGKSSVANSFPQKHPWDRSKDSLENKLHRLVCSGKYPVARAQSRIASNWYRLWLEVKKL